MIKAGKASVSLCAISILVVSLVAVTFFSTVNFASTQEAGVQVSGIISSNITWTKSNSPYVVTGNTLVAEGVILTIEPGVEVKFAQGTELAVDGVLNANGTSTNPIIFTSNATTPKPNDWSDIRFREKSTDALCLLNWTIIKYANIGVLAYASSPTIQNSIITNNAYFGIYASSVFMIGDTGNPIVNNCTISDNGGSPDGGGKQGGILADVAGRITVQDSLIENNTGYGIRAYGGTTVTHCTIRNNTNTGAYGEMQIAQSEITRNSQSGIIASGPVLYNIILDNSPYDLAASGNVNATYNWWGTTNETVIAQHIFDYYDDYNQGKVTFAPFLNDSNTFFIISASLTQMEQ